MSTDRHDKDLFARAIKRPSVSFDSSRGGHKMGDKVVLEVLDYVNVLQDRDDKTGELLWWDAEKTQPKEKWVLTVREGDIEKGLWGNMSRKDGSLFSAVGKAQVAAQEKTGNPDLRIGDVGKGGKRGVLEVIWYDEDDTPRKADPKADCRKLFKARFTAPEPGPAERNEDPWAEEAPATPESAAPANTPAAAESKSALPATADGDEW